jgi:3-hydroxyacyl-[acyl-carrier-protein] dehydratase
MLIDNFYHITDLKKTEDTLQAEIRLNPDHALYKGHFPQQAVVPGVMQIQIVKEILEEELNQGLLIREVTVAKYFRPITPQEHPVLNIDIAYKLSETGDYMIDASIVKADTTFAKIKAKLSLGVK